MFYLLCFWAVLKSNPLRSKIIAAIMPKTAAIMPQFIHNFIHINDYISIPVYYVFIKPGMRQLQIGINNN